MTMLLLALLGCNTARPLADTLPCEDAAVAISRRTYECTNDGDLANQRYEDVVASYECIPVTYETDIEGAWYDVIEDAPGNWFHCAFAIGELPCELVEAYGDDFELWLDASPVCAVVMEPRP